MGGQGLGTQRRVVRPWTRFAPSLARPGESPGFRLPGVPNVSRIRDHFTAPLDTARMNARWLARNSTMTGMNDIGRAALVPAMVLRASASQATSAAAAAAPVMKQKLTLRKKIKAYMELSKFRLSSLVVLTSSAGYLAAGSPVDLCTLAAVTGGTALAAASAAALNQWYETKQDGMMNRTKGRPLPSGRLSSKQALTFAATTAVAGTGVLWTATNPVVAALGAANIALYAGPYTITKQTSEINTWIGAVVGAIPPVMGWAAASTNLIAWEPALLGSLLFLWQFPHFFALSWMYKDDYTRGGYQMVPVNDPTGIRTASLISRYSVYLAALPIIATATGTTTFMFGLEGTMANAYLLYLASKFNQDRSRSNARKIFLTSLWYLPLLMGGFVFHSTNWDKDKQKIKEQAEAALADTDEVTEAVLGAKGALKGVCVHEVFAHRDNTTHPNACPIVVAEKVAEKTADTTKDVAAAVADAATKKAPEHGL